MWTSGEKFIVKFGKKYLFHNDDDDDDSLIIIQAVNINTCTTNTPHKTHKKANNITN